MRLTLIVENGLPRVRMVAESGDEALLMKSTIRNHKEWIASYTAVDRGRFSTLDDRRDSSGATLDLWPKIEAPKEPIEQNG